MTLSRRGVLKGGVVLGGGAALPAAGPSTARADDRRGDGEPGTTVRQATNVALSCHRPSRLLALDAHNVIWTVPLSGGTARRLTDDLEDATKPSFFPDGRHIAFQSFREGSYGIAVVDVATRIVTRLTPGPQYDLDPAVSPDGAAVAYVSDEGGTSAIWLWEAATGRSRPLVGTLDDRAYHAPTWHPDGRRLSYGAENSAGSVLETVEVATGEVTVLRRAAGAVAFRGAAHGPDGRLAYIAVDGPRATLHVDGAPLTGPFEEPAPLSPAWVSATELVHGGDGRVWRRPAPAERGSGTPAATEIQFAVTLAAPAGPARSRATARRSPLQPDEAPVRGIVAPVLSPDGASVCYAALGAIWVQRLGGTARRVVDDGYGPTDPDWFPDGSALVYSSDRDGVPDLWRYTFATGRHERLTRRPAGALAPRVAPGGDRVAHQDEQGATWLLDVATGENRRIAPPTDQPGRPAFSPDGRFVSMAVGLPASERDTAGHHAVLTVDTVTGARTVRPVAPHRSVATRGDDGPVWTPDGTHLLVVLDSRLHRVPVTPHGTVTGPPEPLSPLIADSVSAAASGHVLFLSLGELVVLPPGRRGRPRRHTVPLTCRRRARPPRTVVRAGRLWDGRSDRYLHHVDITVADGTVTAVEPVGRDAPAPTIDASDRTVIPGLIDTHNHWHLRGGAWGSRQGLLWLAYGVTTSRSVGDPVYRMAHTREAIHSGALIGPRYLGSGEPLDGTRASFGFMRTVSSAAQLDRELRRVIAFDYAVVKSYQRLPVHLERVLVRRLARHGIPVTSHYLYPAAATGLDGMEHTGGGNRLGYSRTLSAAGGRTAQDTVDLLVRSGMWVSTTLLFANELFAGGVSALSADLLHDRRTRTLFPAWEYERLLEKAARADGPDNELNEAWTAGDVDLLRRVHEAGGLVVAGTDAPLDDVGISMHQNLRALVRHGFSPLAALRTATVNAARCLGAEGTLGVIAPGARADLLVVDGDPLRDIADAARIDRVVVDGHPYTTTELLAPFEGRSPEPDGPPAHGTFPVRTVTHLTCCRDHPGRAHGAGR